MELLRGKRAVLFFLVAIVPAIVLVVLATRVFHQEEELANKHAADQRQEALEQVRRELGTKLEAIKLEQVNRLRDEVPSPAFRSRPPADSAVIFVLPIEQERIVMPWENKRVSAPPSAEYLRLWRAGERAEFQMDSPVMAADAYRKAVTAGHEVNHICEAKLGMARALMKSGKAAAANEVYKAITHECDLDLDDDGISVSLYAAERLITNDLDVVYARQYVLSLTKANRWWPPTQLYLMRSLLAPETTDEARRTFARAFRRRLKMRSR